MLEISRELQTTEVTFFIKTWLHLLCITLFVVKKFYLYLLSVIIIPIYIKRIWLFFSVLQLDYIPLPFQKYRKAVLVFIWFHIFANIGFPPLLHYLSNAFIVPPSLTDSCIKYKSIKSQTIKNRWKGNWISLIPF